MTPTARAAAGVIRRAVAVERRTQGPRSLYRCPNCGSWRYLSQCWTPLAACQGEATR